MGFGQTHRDPPFDAKRDWLVRSAHTYAGAVDLWYHTPVRQATLLGELISADPALVTAGWRGTKAPLTAMTAAM